MAAYYNENDQFAAAWLRNLIEAGLIADGEVDERSIKEVRVEDLKGFAQCHFFAGIGGWSYALRLAGWADDRPVWTGSCPCQPFSQAGKRKGFADDRHLWPVWRALIEDARPGIVFGEQVASAAEWLGLVRGDMGALGYVFGARPFEAASAGADHLRNRIGFVAHDAAPRKGRRRVQRPGESTGAAQERSSSQSARPSHHIDLADNNNNNKGSQGRPLPAERAGERAARPDGVADSDQSFGRIGNEQSAGQFPQQQQDTRTRVGEFDWVLGADGKARRVERGVRLLAHAVSGRMVVRRTVQPGAAEIQEEHWYNRVGALKGFGNAIDPRAFAQFIAAADEAMHETRAA